MSLSAWTTQADGGSFSSLTFPSTRPYSHWYNNVCESYPYAYLSPFAFEYTLPDGSSSGSKSYCPWPQVNSGLRLTATCMAIVTLGVLFVKTPLSLFARPIYAFYALLFFAVFVLDAGVQAAGLAYCEKVFIHSDLNIDITSLGMTISCSSSGESVIVVFNIVASALFFILHSAWGLTNDLYVNHGVERKKLSKNMHK
jgi:hypothetical protein